VSTPVDESSIAERRHVRIGDQVIGGHRLPVIAGPRLGADIVHVSLRRQHGAKDAAAELARIRDLSPAPLVVEPFSASDLAAIRTYADGIVVGGEWMQDFRSLSAVGQVGLPVIVQRGQHATMSEWLAAVDYIRVEGTEDVVLSEGGIRGHSGDRPVVDLALVREVSERSGRPTIVDLSSTPWLAGAAIAAGADGVWMAEHAHPSDVDAARDAVTVLAPALRQDTPDTLAECREAIDGVDAALAILLEHRVAIAGEVQRLKPVGGHAGRDAAREAQIVRAMAHRAPSLGKAQLARIMDAVISAGLDAAEEVQDPPVWRL
jgi:chorismate mutase